MNQSLAEVLPPDCIIQSRTLLTNSSSNHGHTWRLTLSDPDNELPRSVVLKLVQFQQLVEPFLREMVSLHVERYFYSRVSKVLTPFSPVARSYPVAEGSRSEALLLEDLSEDFPFPALYTSSEAKIHTALKWLANFHASLWDAGGSGFVLLPDPLTAPNPEGAYGVWEQGGWWHLDTRRDELTVLQGKADEYGWLLPYVEGVARRLRTEAVGRTLIHGNPRAANIMFSDRTPEATCVFSDFQWVGSGLCVQDLVFFLATSVDSRKLKDEEGLLAAYHAELVVALARNGGRGDGKYTLDVLKEQWEWALVDWMRFLGGWGCWGNADWVIRRSKEICERWRKEGISFD